MSEDRVHHGRDLRDDDTIRRLRAENERLRSWRSIDSAPKDGTEILLYCPGEAGTGRPLVGHYTSGGGEEQPHFGPAWFVWSGFSFRELPKPPTAWAPIPSLEAARKGELLG